MQKFLKHFDHCVIRDYKGGKEIRTQNLDDELSKAKRLISKKHNNIEIFENDCRLRSFSVREV